MAQGFDSLGSFNVNFDRFKFTTMNQNQIKSLIQAISDLLMSNPDMGLGEINECQEAAKELVYQWMESNQIITL